MNIHHLSSKIIDVLESMIDEQIIICDVDAIIIASTDSYRIGDYHEGAAEVIKNREQLIITKDLAKKLKGVKTGFNLPLFFNKSAIGVIGITGEIEKVKPFGEIVRKMTELLINESYFNEQIEFEHRALENFIYELLQNKKLNRHLLDRAETLGVILDGNKQVILISISKNNSVIQKEVWQYIKELIPKKDVLIRWGNNRLFWIHTVHKSKQIKVDYLKTIKKSSETNFSIELNIGVGDFVSSGELHYSYEQALTAIKYSTTDSGISYHTDLQLELCLQEVSDKTKNEFIYRTLGNLIDNKQLLETLSVFLEEQSSLKKTADRLFIHINTLHYRLSKIHQMTSLDPKCFTDLVNLYLAVSFLEEYTTVR